jgi:hypothetical protein
MLFLLQLSLTVVLAKVLVATIINYQPKLEQACHESAVIPTNSPEERLDEWMDDLRFQRLRTTY